VDGGAAVADAGAQPHDGIAVDTSQTLDGADGAALDQGGDDFDLLIAGKNVHGTNPWLGIKLGSLIVKGGPQPPTT